MKKLTLMIFASLTLVLPRAEGREPSQPNFVVIMADDLGYGDISPYGGWIETPRLARMAKEGLKFTDFHSNGPVCSPTRAALLTGRYQQRAGIPGVVYADPEQNRHHGLHEQETTFAELLSAADYNCGVFGKWHVGYRRRYNPLVHGFDEFRGFVSGNIDYISHYDRMDVYDWWNGLEKIEEPGYSTHLITRRAVNFIERNKDEPFCLYVAHEAPHSPYQAPSDPPIRGPNAEEVNLNNQQIKQRYRIMVEEMDKGIGAILDTLEQHDLAENTYVFFFSDNGANRNGSNGKLRGNKGSVWEGGHRAPCIVWKPGEIEPGETSETAMTMDILPTLLDLAGIDDGDHPPLDGVSLAGLLGGQEKLEPRTLFWSYRGRSAVRKGPWKLVVNAPRQKQAALYNLEEDLAEQNDLADENKEMVRELSTALERWRIDVQEDATVQPEKE